MEIYKSSLIDIDNRIAMLQEFGKEMATQSDRGVVLVSISILDEMLADLIKVKLLDDEKLIKDMFGTKGVFGQFDDKVKACYAMGLISQLDYDLLRNVQGIRNKFAHRILNVSFEDPSIRDSCKNITLPKNAFIPPNLGIPGHELNLNPIKKDTPARERFLVAFHFLYTEIGYRELMGEITPLSKPADYVTIPMVVESFERTHIWKMQTVEDMEKSHIKAVQSYKEEIERREDEFLKEKDETVRKIMEVGISKIKEVASRETDLRLKINTNQEESQERFKKWKAKVMRWQAEIEKAKE